MSCHSHYEIIVSQNGKHLFTTSPHSFTAERDKAEKAFELLTEAFPASKGFRVEGYFWECHGTHADLKAPLSKLFSPSEPQPEYPKDNSGE